MKKRLKFPMLILSPFLIISILSGCSGDGFSYSSEIDDNGYWKNVTALDCVELCDYQNISIPGDVHQITDDAIQTEIDSILEEYATSTQVTDRAVADGDTVNIDYVGTIDGVEFEGGSTEGEGSEVTIGVTSFIDDFLEQLIGHMPGETFDVEVTFPDDYVEEELNGKDAVFAVTINYIAESKIPELTDAFVEENLSETNGWATVTEMKEGIKSDLQESAIYNYLADYLVENTVISVLPESILKYQEDYLVFYYQDCASYYGVELSEFLSTYVGVSSTDELLETYSEDNQKTASLYLIIQAIAEDASLSVDETTVANYFKTYVGVDDYSDYEEAYGMPYLKLSALNQAVMDYLSEHATLA